MAVNVVMLGPPGAGKGTQAARLAHNRGLLKISTGVMLREAAGEMTAAGRLAKAKMDAGLLVDDDTMVAIICQRLHGVLSGRGFVLDGFPRTVGQARALDHLVADKAYGLLVIIAIDVPDEDLLRRLSLRRPCRTCGESPDVIQLGRLKRCTRCGGDLVQRSDDAEDIVHERLSVYRREMTPLFEYYRPRQSFYIINGAQPVDHVAADLAIAVDSVAHASRSSNFVSQGELNRELGGGYDILVVPAHSPENVSRLMPQWVFQTDTLGKFETTPLSPRAVIDACNPRNARAATFGRPLGIQILEDDRGPFYNFIHNHYFVIDLSQVAVQAVRNYQTYGGFDARRTVARLFLGVGTITDRSGRVPKYGDCGDGARHRVGDISWTQTWQADPAEVQECVYELGAISAESAAGGVRTNAILKEGGSRFTGYAFGAMTNDSLMRNNVTPALEARSLGSSRRSVARIDERASVRRRLGA